MIMMHDDRNSSMNKCNNACNVIYNGITLIELGLSAFSYMHSTFGETF